MLALLGVFVSRLVGEGGRGKVLSAPSNTAFHRRSLFSTNTKHILFYFSTSATTTIAITLMMIRTSPTMKTSNKVFLTRTKFHRRLNWGATRCRRRTRDGEVGGGVAWRRLSRKYRGRR